MFERDSSFGSVSADEDTAVKQDNTRSDTVEKQRILWLNVFTLVILHIAGLYSFVVNFGQTKIITLLWGFVLGMWGMLGITAGAHRLWSHHSYKAKLPMEIILMIGYAIAAEYPPWDWVRYHRIHHKCTDKDADPHNSSRGLFYSQWGWLMMTKHPETIKEEKLVDMSDTLADKNFMFFTRNYSYFSMIFGFGIPIIGPMVLWNESFYCSVSVQLFRYVMVNNFASTINSISHTFGYKPYKKHIRATEGLFTSIITLGEGWHNYHHSFPWDYKAGEVGPYKFNVSTTFIYLCSKLGWAYDLKEASPTIIQSISKRYGDESYDFSSSK